uniref:Uncharacterized protein n=1 Tax=Ditylenchus dipsaci TaxID=166011 RepID=A0A915D064_9BILA
MFAYGVAVLIFLFHKPIQIFTNALQRLPESVSSGLSKSAVRKMAGRVRSRNGIQVLQANAVEEIRIPQDHRYYGQGGELFVLADSGEHFADPDRIIIFGRQQNLQWAAEMVNVYMDGTFSITPAPFTQVNKFQPNNSN